MNPDLISDVQIERSRTNLDDPNRKTVTERRNRKSQQRVKKGVSMGVDRFDSAANKYVSEAADLMNQHGHMRITQERFLLAESKINNDTQSTGVS